MLCPLSGLPPGGAQPFSTPWTQERLAACFLWGRLARLTLQGQLSGAGLINRGQQTGSSAVLCCCWQRVEQPPPPPPASCGSQTSLPLCAPLLHHGTRAPPTGMALTRPRATLQAVPRTICRPLPRTAAPPAHPVHAASCRASQLSHFWLSMWTKVGPSKPPPCAREAGATAPPAVGGCHKGTASGCTSATRQGKAHPLTIAGSQTQLVEGVDAPWVKAPLPASSASTHRMSNAGQ